MGLKNKMAARIVFVDDETIDEVFCGEDSDEDQNSYILKVKKRKMMRVKNKAAVKMKMKKTTRLLVLANQQDSTSQLLKA